MKIAKVEIFPITHPIEVTANYSFGNYTADKNLVVRITSDTGVTGVGSSGGLRPHFSGESVASAIDNIARLSREMLIGEDPFAIERIVNRMDEMLLGNNCTKSNIDCALYDLKGKALGVPVYELIGGRCRSRVKLNWVICDCSFDFDAMVKEGLEAVEAGYTVLKIRGFGDPASDIARFDALRDAVGPDIGIGIDCNSSYRDAKSALQVFRYMESRGLVSVEEPVTQHNIAGLKYIRDNLTIPVTCDETAWSEEAIVNLIRAGAIDGVELVPCRVGGLTKAMRIRSICDAFGIERTLTQYGQNGICNAIAAQFIAASPAPEDKVEELGGYINYHASKGYYDTDHVVGDIIKTPSVKISGGYLKIPEAPGLGVELDEERVMSLISEGYEPIIIE